MYVCVFVYIYICVCVCVYIYSHPRRNCFIVSKIISVARQVRWSKPGLKPSWLYASQIFYHTATNKLSVSEGILMHMYHFCFVYIYTLNDYRILNSLKELCITQVAAGNSFEECSIYIMHVCLSVCVYIHVSVSYIYIYIYIYNVGVFVFNF